MTKLLFWCTIRYSLLRTANQRFGRTKEKIVKNNSKRQGSVAMAIFMMIMAIGGMALIIHGNFFAGFCIVILSGIYGAIMALVGDEPDWKWLRRICDRIRRYHARWQKERQYDLICYLDSLSLEERERELVMLATEESEDSFLHPRNLPYDRVKPGSFD